MPDFIRNYETPSRLFKTLPGIPNQNLQTEIETVHLKEEAFFGKFIIYTSLFSLFYTFICWFVGYMMGVYLTFGVFCSVVLIGIAPKKKFPLTLSSNLFVLCYTISIYFNAFFSGGMHSPVAAWLTFIPLLPLILGRFYSARVWLFIAVILVSSLYFLEGFQKTLTTKPVGNNMLLFQYSVIIGLVILVFTIVHLFDNYKNTVYSTLDIRNKQLDDANAQLEEKQRSENRFIAIVSHELRSPMTAIIGVTDILLKDETDRSKLELLEAMKRSAFNLSLLLNDILDNHRIKAGKFKASEDDFDLRQSVDSVSKLFKPLILEKHLTLIIKIEENIPEVLNGDARRLNQILTNLLGNAIKFTRVGKVEIRISGLEKSPGKLLLHIEVEDTGVGIPKDKLHKIFDEFEQANESISKDYGGTGFGLTITRQILELLGGEISVESTLGIGSCFTVILPMNMSSKPNIKEPETFDNNMLNKLEGIKILLAEDSALSRLIVRKQLGALLKDVEIDFASNGEEALFKFNSGKYDILLLDVLMPKLTGLDVARNIRKQGNQIKIIALTANVLENEVKECFEAGMNEFIAKPFDKYELVRTIYSQLYPN